MLHIGLRSSCSNELQREGQLHLTSSDA